MPLVFVDGKTYDHRETIKKFTDKENRRLFRWQPALKRWEAKIADSEIDELAEQVKTCCPGCSLHVDTDYRDPPVATPHERFGPPEEPPPF